MATSSAVQCSAVQSLVSSLHDRIFFLCLGEKQTPKEYKNFSLRNFVVDFHPQAMLMSYSYYTVQYSTVSIK
jgi:hypothetical protein